MSNIYTHQPFWHVRSPISHPSLPPPLLWMSLSYCITNFPWKTCLLSWQVLGSCYSMAAVLHFVNSVAFREQSAKNIGWGLEPGPHAWVPSRFSFALIFTNTQFSCSAGAGERRAGCVVFTTVKGLHLTTEKVRWAHLAQEYLQEEQLSLNQHRHLFGIVDAAFLLFYLAVLIITL